jgi:hypothetical protein
MLTLPEQDRKYNGPSKKDKNKKAKDRETRISLKTESELRYSERIRRYCSTPRAGCAPLNPPLIYMYV